MASKWIKLKDKMPDGGEYLVWGKITGDDEPNIHLALFYDDTLDFIVCGDISDRKIIGVTHWMRLPNIPSGVKI